MPILPILYAVSLALCFGGGYYYGWANEYGEVVKLQNDLEEIHIQSVTLQRQAQQQVEAIKETQETNIIELEKRYHESITTNVNLHDELVNAQRMHRASNTASGCNRVSKAGNTSRSKEDVIRESKLETNRVSEELDSYLQSNANKIDKLDQDKHYLLDWINNIPKELINEEDTNNKNP